MTALLLYCSIANRRKLVIEMTIIVINNIRDKERYKASIREQRDKTRYETIREQDWATRLKSGNQKGRESQCAGHQGMKTL